jgi:ubiquinone/menaquinone biosynthesis C-methylase UbiE
MPHEHKGRGSGMIVDTRKVISLLVRPGDRFVDLGCGPGDYLKQAAKTAKKVIGMDRDTASIERVKSLGFEAVLADISASIPLEDHSVDSVLMANVLHGLEVQGWEKALAEIARILKIGSRFGIVEFKKDSLFGPPKEIRLESERIQEIVVPFGFILLGKHDVGLFNYMMIFECA